MSFILYDDPALRLRLLPFTHTRPIADIRCGVFTLRERWEHFFGEASGTHTASYLQTLFPDPETCNVLLVNGGVFGTKDLADELRKLEVGEALIADGCMIGARLAILPDMPDAGGYIPHDCRKKSYDGPVKKLHAVWDIFSFADAVLREEIGWITEGTTSALVPNDISVRGEENLFVEEGAIVGAGTIINASAGPVYISKGAEVMEGCLLRGPLFIGEGAVIKMGAKIYSATSIGPGCKVGGEVQNTVFFANSNKGHDGYLGNAVIGEWCNLGADTNCSNLKNNYDEVKIWDEATNRGISTGLTFCGLIMGDHSKSGINTMFNTGTVVGVSCNIWGGGFPKQFIPSFSWGGPDGGFTTYNVSRAIETAKRALARRNRVPSEVEESILRHVFENTAHLRKS